MKKIILLIDNNFIKYFSFNIEDLDIVRTFMNFIKNKKLCEIHNIDNNEVLNNDDVFIRLNNGLNKKYFDFKLQNEPIPSIYLYSQPNQSKIFLVSISANFLNISEKEFGFPFLNNQNFLRKWKLLTTNIDIRIRKETDIEKYQIADFKDLKNFIFNFNKNIFVYDPYLIDNEIDRLNLELLIMYLASNKANITLIYGDELKFESGIIINKEMLPKPKIAFDNININIDYVPVKKKVNLDRYLLTDFYSINLNHSLQSFKKNKDGKIVLREDQNHLSIKSIFSNYQDYQNALNDLDDIRNKHSLY